MVNSPSDHGALLTDNARLARELEKTRRENANLQIAKVDKEVSDKETKSSLGRWGALIVSISILVSALGSSGFFGLFKSDGITKQEMVEIIEPFEKKIDKLEQRERNRENYEREKREAELLWRSKIERALDMQGYRLGNIETGKGDWRSTNAQADKWVTDKVTFPEPPASSNE